ncbi:hypothetical protein BU15DRAFT_60941 [Melanogaster broomeanus]|nr:hypothetical protein BU15DRAFT_60941 [Melanogaster broomeanus]
MTVVYHQNLKLGAIHGIDCSALMFRLEATDGPRRIPWCKAPNIITFTSKLLHEAGLVATIWLLAVFGRNTNVRESPAHRGIAGGSGPSFEESTRRARWNYESLSTEVFSRDTNIREVDRVVRKPENREGGQVHKVRVKLNKMVIGL